MAKPALTVAIPTRDRAPYLDVALRSLRRQRTISPYELLVVDDGSRDGSDRLAAELCARVIRLTKPQGLNAARNRAVEAAEAPLIAFVDDDVKVPPQWVSALLHGTQRYPEGAAFGGPIRPCIEGPGGRGCGREQPPITTLDLGSQDRPVEMVWGANMAIRKEAFALVGPFDETLSGHGDEEEWLRALRRQGGAIYYLAGAWLEHRRAPADARYGALAKMAYRRGVAARRTDRRRGQAPPLGRELLTLAGCVGHAVRYRCPQGLIMAAHSLGRVRSAVGG